jgi:magnesium chelatase family protein
VSLAHHGCLFLDELLEFKRNVLEALRQPLEDGSVMVCRARARVVFPARPLLVAAVNPCPCGFHGDRAGRCVCTPERIAAYCAKLSGPLLDRIDLQIPLPPVDIEQLQTVKRGESSASVRERVVKARAVQTARLAAGEAAARCNADLTPTELDRLAAPGAGAMKLLASAVERLGLSARAYGKVLRVARTIADLEGSSDVRQAHVAEAIQMRLLDRTVAFSPAHAEDVASA